MKKSLPIFFIILALLISNCGHNEQGIDNLEIEALTTHDLNQEEPITSPELQKENENRLEKITEKHSIQNI